MKNNENKKNDENESLNDDDYAHPPPAKKQRVISLHDPSNESYCGINVIDGLQTKLGSFDDASDLFQFIQIIYDNHQSRQQLVTSLNKQLLQISPEMRLKLLIRLNQMQTIPSPDVQSHIISYLNHNDLSNIPVVSKNFNGIVHRNAYIYNENGYVLIIRRSENSVPTINIDHENKAIRVTTSNGEVPHPFNQIRKWGLFDGDITLLENNANNIHSLALITCYSQLTENELKFPNCIALQASQTNILANDCFICFGNLQCLWLYRINITHNKMNRILKHCSKSLLFLSLLDLKLEYKTCDDEEKDDEYIEVPSNIQWFTFYSLDKNIGYDLSECSKIIGLELFFQRMKFDELRIIYPSSIPFVSSNRNIINEAIQNKYPWKILSCWDSMTFNQSGHLMRFNEIKKKYHKRNKVMVLEDELIFSEFMQLVMDDESERENMILKLKQMVDLADLANTFLGNLINQ